MRNGRPVCYTSKNLSPVKYIYERIDKELLAILFACYKSYQYTYGQNSTVQTYHLPLVSLMEKKLIKFHQKGESN